MNTCIILAGGLGTRLRSAVPDKPKCLAPIGDKSFLQIQLELLASQGVDNFVLSLGYMADMVIDEVKKLDKKYKIQTVIEAQPLGTGGAILWAMNFAGLDEAIVTNGDTFLGGSLATLLKPLDLRAQELARMAIVDVVDRARYGGVTLDGALVTGFVEKGASAPGAINAGLYRLHRNVFNTISVGDACSLESHILPLLVNQRCLSATRIEGEFTDIGVPEDYFGFCKQHA
jgi:D-glycero-alpha-D-manno-heptose 1-phosphate guanylyltransferase